MDRWIKVILRGQLLQHATQRAADDLGAITVPAHCTDRHVLSEVYRAAG